MTRTRARETFFITCAPGLEPLLHAEARELRLGRIERQVGGVRFSGTLEDAWRANLHLRTAVRVLLRVSRFRATDADSLYSGVRACDWRRFLGADGTLAVAAQTRESRLDHSLFVVQKTKDAIVDQLRERRGERPSVDRSAADLNVHVHLYRDRCTVSVDTSGASLHKRGWRRFQGRAPLAESLAAAVLGFSRWDGAAPLVDPFCGSGTILVEAALLAARVPPGMFRERFAFERFPQHDASAWRGLREKARRAIRPRPRLILRGLDADPAAVEGARENVHAAGVEARIEIEVGDAARHEFKRGWNGWIVTNPPYGERIGDRGELVDLYRRFGAHLRGRCGGYRLALLCGDPSLERALGLVPRRRVELRNGPLRCHLLCLEVPGG